MLQDCQALLRFDIAPAEPAVLVCRQDIGVLLQKSIALPDVHSGYGFAIGNVAAFDMADPESIVSPGGVGFGKQCLSVLGTSA